MHVWAYIEVKVLILCLNIKLCPLVSPEASCFNIIISHIIWFATFNWKKNVHIKYICTYRYGRKPLKSEISWIDLLNIFQSLCMLTLLNFNIHFLQSELSILAGRLFITRECWRNWITLNSSIDILYIDLLIMHKIYL